MISKEQSKEIYIDTLNVLELNELFLFPYFDVIWTNKYSEKFYPYAKLLFNASYPVVLFNTSGLVWEYYVLFL